MNYVNSFLENIINYRKRPINIFMLSPEDYAGSGCRIRDAVRKVAKKDKITINLITAKRRNIGFNNADIVLSDGEQALKKAQKLLDKADIVHFKDDNPPVDGMYGLIIPPNAKIVHTAGGSGFRRVSRSLITEENVSRKIKLPLNDIGDAQSTWKINNIEESFSLPVLAILTDPDNLWDDSLGIYTNYLEEGVNWEKRSINQLESYTQKHDITYYDFNFKNDDDYSNYNYNDFADKSHFSKNGAEKFSLVFADSLKYFLNNHFD